jgi:hypothetical protein
MKNIARTALAVLTLSLAAQVPAHAQDLCIPLLTCQTSGSGGSGSGGDGGNSADCPEISGNLIGTGFALVAGVAAMMPRRRKSATRITDL